MRVVLFLGVWFIGKIYKWLLLFIAISYLFNFGSSGSQSFVQYMKEKQDSFFEATRRSNMRDTVVDQFYKQCAAQAE